MSPFTLLQLVGPAVAGHVLRTLHDKLGARFRLSPALDALAADGRPLVVPGEGGLDEPAPWVQEAFGAPAPGARDADAVREHVLVGLTQETGALLDEGVVAGPDDVDVCMILGAGWPFHLGGITPYLDREGWSQRVLGHTFR
jgi:3-hydroxyacyl-CoA dehydrogenase